MTREDAINHIKDIIYENNTIKHNNIVVFEEEKEALRVAIEALEQDPCEDAISRQAVLDCLTATGLKKYDFILNARDKIKNLPSVKPQEPFDIETYCKEQYCDMVDKALWSKAKKALERVDKLTKYPLLDWQYLNLNDTDFWNFVNNDLKDIYPEASNTYLFYFKQKYDHEKEYEYLTCLIEISPTCNIIDWDYDEGQTDRIWLAYADLSDVTFPYEN